MEIDSDRSDRSVATALFKSAMEECDNTYIEIEIGDDIETFTPHCHIPVEHNSALPESSSKLHHGSEQQNKWPNS